MTDPYFDERNNWLRLEKELADRDLALIVGAGISYASGFPTWPEMVRMLATNAKIAYKVLSKINASPPAQLAIIRQTYGNEDDRWVEAVRSVLYDGFRQKCKGQVAIPELPNKYSDDDFARFIENTNPVLASIVQLCAMESRVNSHGKVFRGNPRIGALLTYNLDALLQLYDRARHGTPRVLRTIERASKRPHTRKLNLYHLHGYLLQTRGKPEEETTGRLILIENEYNDRTDDAYCYPSAITMWALHAFVCLFVGCSMTDELMRRALHRWKKERMTALRDENPGKKLKRKKWRRHFAVMKEPKKLEKKELMDKSLELLGVWPLWVKNFERELPSCLHNLQNALRTAGAD